MNWEVSVKTVEGRKKKEEKYIVEGGRKEVRTREWLIIFVITRIYTFHENITS